MDPHVFLQRISSHSLPVPALGWVPASHGSCPLGTFTAAWGDRLRVHIAKMRHLGLSHHDAFGRFCIVEECSGACLFKRFKLGLEIQLSLESACLTCTKGLGSIPSSAHTGVVIYTPIPALKRQEDQEFKASLGHSGSLEASLGYLSLKREGPSN